MNAILLLRKVLRSKERECCVTIIKERMGNKEKEECFLVLRKEC